MRKVVVQEGQSVWDISKQEYGTIAAVFLILDDNTTVMTSLNEPLTTGTILKVREEGLVTTDQTLDRKRRQIVARFKEKGIHPANMAGVTDFNPSGGSFSSGFSDGFEIE